MEGSAGPLAPLTGRRVAHSVQGLFGAAFTGCPAVGDAAGWCDRGVPDRPAETRLDSLIAAVHCRDDGEAERVALAEAWVHRLDRQAAVMAQRCRVGARTDFGGHVVSLASSGTAPTRSIRSNLKPQ